MHETSIMLGSEGMKRCALIAITLIVVCVMACSRSESRYGKIIDEAEIVMRTDRDSAMSMLDAIEPTELSVDSIRAKYHYLKAIGHLKQNRSLIGDSLITYAHKYYRDKDVERSVLSGTALAWYKFWVGDTPGAISMLDSLVNLTDVPDSIMVSTLRVRALLGAAEYQGHQLIPLAKRLVDLESDSLRKMEAKYVLMAGYEYAGETDSALNLINELIDFSHKNSLGDKQFILELEHAQLLTEIGKNDESDKIIEYIFRQAGPDNGAADYLHFQYALNALNTGDVRSATQHLATADSIAMKLRSNDDAYYRSYSNLIHAIIDFKQTGQVKLRHINGLNNRQNERFNRIEASQWESERGALRQESRALALKAESQQKTIIILTICFIAILIAGGAAWLLVVRHQRERENEERIEALQKMVDEYKSSPIPSQSESTDTTALRRAMLQQLGIIKMVAETPTEQNREMLRKISSIESDTNGELVNWNNVFELIDNLYSGFYKKLHDKYGDRLSQKEEQIIVLMLAGFSTKEISVITSQTTSTIYVRKSSIRKKLGVPEKEDIIAFLEDVLKR